MHSSGNLFPSYTTLWESVYCAVLCCTALYCAVLRCTAVHCGALRCTAVHCGALRCIAVHCGALRCTAVHCGALRCIAVHCGALRCTAVHYGTLRCIAVHRGVARRTCFQVDVFEVERPEAQVAVVRASHTERLVDTHTADTATRTCIGQWKYLSKFDYCNQAVINSD